MNERKNEDNQEDLSDFEDYLAQFDSIIKFDLETCPLCCVENSDNLPIQNSLFVFYKCLTEESELISVTNELKLKHIPFRVDKRNNNESNNQTSYIYDIMVPNRCLIELQKLKR